MGKNQDELVNLVVIKVVDRTTKYLRIMCWGLYEVVVSACWS